MKVKKAVIPAAGFGTRFLPATKSTPKEMLTIVDRPAIHYNVEELIEAGIEDILIIIGRNKEEIANYFDRSPELELFLKENGKEELYDLTERISNMANIHYVRQKDARGLGHAVLCAKTFVGNEPFALLLGDDLVYSSKPCIQQLAEMYEQYESTIIGVQAVDKNQVNKYGIIDGMKVGDSLYEVKDLVEKPNVEEAPSNIAIMGRYILTPDIFEMIENTEPGKGNEIQLTDALKKLNEQKEIYAYEFEGKRYDTGDKLGYLIATVEYALRNEELSEDFRDYLKKLL
ncbi:UTP--glucose-1-phosphate uridylyltransferase GalU [Fusibacter bizertensis]|jgi:UDP-glucose pyrophosphorylase (EC 2.7.7.9)|uniref:UTP--glucose-1-phosphate uridylyltransferase n=1 Tax=Fusibacter bizertensis TaxID=1488331 RepID=A0ABT6NDI0_9FIRM|nr:UTP--glucose-1-phosphate uridylyltransferase GalU [Fusibacter bizertensis]MDH8678483.1 UTP--glucose-1-phosphate uridylyltransferase GalU [Fusibacter bizertensis]